MKPKSSNMDINIAEKKATGELDKQDSASNPKKENLGLGQAEGIADAKAEAKLVQDDDDALFKDLLVAEDLLDADRKYLDCEAAEDADNEISSDDDDYEKILPLNIKEAKTGKEVNQGIPYEEREESGQIGQSHSKKEVHSRLVDAWLQTEAQESGRAGGLPRGGHSPGEGRKRAGPAGGERD